MKTLGAGIRVEIVRIRDVAVAVACQREILVWIVRGRGSGPECVAGAGIPVGGVVEADQEIARAVVMEWRVQGEGHPACTRGGKGALENLVARTHLHPIVVVRKAFFRRVFHKHFDAA